jgi:hypothetical protein
MPPILNLLHMYLIVCLLVSSTALRINTPFSELRPVPNGTINAKSSASYGNCGPAPVYRPPDPLPPDFLEYHVEHTHRKQFGLAVLMNTEGELPNQPLWQEWIDQAGIDDAPVRFHIHTQSNGSLLGNFSKYVIPDKVNATRCDQIRAQTALFRHALQDASVTHVVTVSHNALPIKSFKQMTTNLKKHPRSGFCADDQWIYPRAESWYSMTRPHAELFIRFEEQLRARYRGDCYDEQAYYYPLRAKGEPISDHCVALSDWYGACKEWNSRLRRASCDCPTLKNESNYIGHANKAHPVTFRRLTGTGFREANRNGFWFARKFRENATGNNTLIAARAKWNQKHNRTRRNLTDAS